MNDGRRPRVLVAGADEDDAPPGLEDAAGRVEFSSAGSAGEVREMIAGAEIVFAWRPDRELLEGAFADAPRLRWIQSASAGVDTLLFPALVESDVVVTNARASRATAVPIGPAPTTSRRLPASGSVLR